MNIYISVVYQLLLGSFGNNLRNVEASALNKQVEYFMSSETVKPQ